MHATPSHDQPAAAPAAASRRGVLLLIVLSMLTLFLMLGTAYLVVSTRSRETARAFAKLAMQSEDVRIPHAQLLDAAFLRVVRGGGTVGPTAVPPPGLSLSGTLESLLEDKYGSSTTGTATGVSTIANAPLLQITGITISGSAWGPGAPAPASLEAVTDFPGRVITLLGAGREPTSHRIVRSSTAGGSLSLVVDLPSTNRPFRSPTGSTPFVINGPEFQIHRTTTTGSTKNEPWDAFDDQNMFLTQLTPGTSISSTNLQKIGLVNASDSQRLVAGGTDAYQTGGKTGTIWSGTNGFSYGVDNDGDGAVDGLFVDVGLPKQYAANGDLVNFDVSALVVDLDSRFNVNAHGSLTAYTYSAGTSTAHAGWPRGTANKWFWSGVTATTGTVAVPTFFGLPVGSGYGPAEVNAGWMFPTTSYPSAGTKDTASPPTATYGLLTLSGANQSSQTGVRANGSRFVTGTYTPRVSSVEGRYAEGLFATTASVNTLVSTGTYSMASAGFPLALPGARWTDDQLSWFNDRSVNQVVTGSNSNGGVPTTWWDGSQGYNWIKTGTVVVGGSASLASTRGGFNSPPDLHGRMITTSTVSITGSGTDALPQLAYAKPEWGGTETLDDPYEMRLDPKAPRNVTYTTSGTADNVFSVAELEPVLRPYDTDAFQLPQRLAAMLGGVSEEAKLRITTDSWDTTAITGTAAGNIRDWLRLAANNNVSPLNGTSAVTGLIGGEVARGERFNLNRPFTADKPAVYNATHQYYKQRQAYFKDLYTLMVAVSGTTSPPNLATRQKYAQWAANVVDFRDDDSTMTPFEYDTDPGDGWDVDGDVSSSSGDSDRAVVWGAERPEVIIAATSAWENSSTGEMFILLHRPWNAVAYSRSSGVSEAVSAEPIDVELDVMQGNTGKDLLNLSRKSGSKPFNPSDTSTYPVWRLRLVSGASTSYVRFDINASGTTNELVAPTLSSQYRMAANSWQCVSGTNTVGMSLPAPASPPNPTFSNFLPLDWSTLHPMPNVATPAKRATKIAVYLERLTDPRASATTAMWTADPGNSANDDPANTGTVPMYRIVDKAFMEVVNREPPAMGTPANPEVMRRPPGPLWQWPTTLTTGTPSTSMQAADFNRGSGNAAMWLPWHNRLFASSAELFLVPGSDPAGGAARDALGLLQQYAKPSTPTLLPAISGAFIPNGLLDAVHVPTRFSGIHTTITTANGVNALAVNAGIYSDTTPVNQLSSFREPGRVNLNTVTADDVWNAVVAGPLQTSGSAAPVLTGSQARFTTTPAKAMHNLLALSGSTSVLVSGTVPPVQDTHPLLTPLQSLNPAHMIYTANRLANTATTRSNVFGVWITVRESVANDPDSIKLHRAFYIFDRSIPVAFEPGKDHNVWDAVLLRRIIQ